MPAPKWIEHRDFMTNGINIFKLKGKLVHHCHYDPGMQFILKSFDWEYAFLETPKSKKIHRAEHKYLYPTTNVRNKMIGDATECNNRYSMSEQDFIELVSWRIITLYDTDVCLKDIWYHRMIEIITNLYDNL